MHVGFKGHLATDGSLLGKTGKWRARGWAVVQLGYDGDGALAWDVCLSGGRPRGPAHHQEGRADGLLMLSKKSDWASQGISMSTTKELLMDYEEERVSV